MRQERLFFTMVLKDFYYEWDKQTENPVGKSTFLHFYIFT